MAGNEIETHDETEENPKNKHQIYIEELLNGILHTLGLILKEVEKPLGE